MSDNPQVEPIPHEVCCYHVQSGSRPDEIHKVNLLRYAGNGECSCESFKFEKFRNIECAMLMKKLVEAGAKRSEIPGFISLQTTDTMCKHIYMARYKWTNDTLKAMNEIINEDAQDG